MLYNVYYLRYGLDKYLDKYDYFEAEIINQEGDEGVSAISEKSGASFKCFSLKDGIELKNLNQGDAVSIYNISGVNVFSQRIFTSSLFVALLQGVYIVNVSGVVVKVVVR